jgi:hypothetical protein
VVPEPATEALGGTLFFLGNSGCHKVAENNEATVHQIAAQSPSDKSEIRTKHTPVSGCSSGEILSNGPAGSLHSLTRCAPCDRMLLSTSPLHCLV